MANLEDLSRQRMDFRDNPDGSTTAILTVTLGNGDVHRFEGKSDAAEVDRLAKVIANAEMRELQISGEIAGMSEEEIAGVFGTIYNAAKGVYRGAQKVASSKAFKWAGKGLVLAGAVFPPAAAVGAGMMAASKLSDASIAAEAGAKKTARKLTNAAKRYAGAVSRGNRSVANQVLTYGNRRRKAAGRRSEGRCPRTGSRRYQARQRRSRSVFRGRPRGTRASRTGAPMRFGRRPRGTGQGQAMRAFRRGYF